MKPRRVIFWIEQPEIDDDHLGALRLARWFAAGTGVRVEVVVAHDGPLLGAFPRSPTSCCSTTSTDGASPDWQVLSVGRGPLR